MIELPGLWSLTPIGALLGAIVLFYWLLATGRLVPRKTHETIVAQANKRGDDWQLAAEAKDAVNAEQAKQIHSLIEANKINQQVFLTGKSIAETALPGGA